MFLPLTKQFFLNKTEQKWVLPSNTSETRCLFSFSLFLLKQFPAQKTSQWTKIEIELRPLGFLRGRSWPVSQTWVEVGRKCWHLCVLLDRRLEPVRCDTNPRWRLARLIAPASWTSLSAPPTLSPLCCRRHRPTVCYNCSTACLVPVFHCTCAALHSQLQCNNNVVASRHFKRVRKN